MIDEELKAALKGHATQKTLRKFSALQSLRTPTRHCPRASFLSNSPIAPQESSSDTPLL
jgi:hypothetical protein